MLYLVGVIAHALCLYFQLCSASDTVSAVGTVSAFITL